MVGMMPAKKQYPIEAIDQFIAELAAMEPPVRKTLDRDEAVTRMEVALRSALERGWDGDNLRALVNEKLTIKLRTAELKDTNLRVTPRAKPVAKKTNNATAASPPGTPSNPRPGLHAPYVGKTL